MSSVWVFVENNAGEVSIISFSYNQSNLMQHTCSSGKVGINANFRSNNTRNLRYLLTMLQNILAIT